MTSNPRRLFAVVALACVTVFASACMPHEVRAVNSILGTSHSDEAARTKCEEVNQQFNDPQACYKLILWAIQIEAARKQPWANDLGRTARVRQCIINHESRTSGMYIAENAKSTAAGAYQFVDGTWRANRDRAERHYGRELTNAQHASHAPAEAQDVVAAYVIVSGGGANAWRSSGCF